MGIQRTVLFDLATSARLERAIKRLPGGEALAWRAASRYVAGRSRTDALVSAGRLLEQGHGVSVDLFGERVRDPASSVESVDQPVVFGVREHRLDHLDPLAVELLAVL